MSRVANFFISTSLSKPLELPDYRAWRVDRADNAVEGGIPLYIRSKGWLLDSISKPAVRHCTLTRRGYFVIYMEPTAGFTLDMHRIVDISATTDKSRNANRRCVMKLRFPFGTVNIFLLNGNIERWRTALQDAVTATRDAPATRAAPSQNVASMYAWHEAIERPTRWSLTNIIAIGDVPAKAEDTPMIVELPDVDASTCDDDYQCLATVSPSRLAAIVEEQFEEKRDEPSDASPSLPDHVPVAWLRRQLEVRTAAESRKRPLYVPAPAVSSSSLVLAEPVRTDSPKSKTVKLLEESDVPATFNAFQFWRQRVDDSSEA